jgi:hypothetical protein
MSALFLACTLAVAAFAWLALHAPDGFEDSAGFNLGRERV